MIATEEFVDPFQLADDLTWATLRYPPLLDALLENDVKLGLNEIERALIEYPNMPPWAAVYLKGKLAKSADALTRR